MRGSRSRTDAEQLYAASQWQLMRYRFTRHRLAIVGSVMLGFFYLVAAFAEIVAPYDPNASAAEHSYAPPQRIRIFDAKGGLLLRPFVYGMVSGRDPVTLAKTHELNREERNPIRLFTRGESYRMWGLFDMDLHLFGVADGTIFLLGTDEFGRDLLSRTVYAARISLSVGLIGVALSMFFGCALGGISGFYGGTPDMIIQRAIELLMSIPAIPLWMALSAAMPLDWPPVRVYFAITMILSILSWTVLARVVRGKILQLKGEDFVTAAKVAGQGDRNIITRHLIPSILSLIIVNVTLAIPGMILAETSLSFLGLGLRPPVVSWGVLLKDAQSVRNVALNPWLLLPALFVIAAVLAFNFLGDGLRDAADPYKR